MQRDRAQEMKINVTREVDPDERRCAMDPAAAQRLIKLGAELTIESGAGTGAGLTDDAFESAGAKIDSNRDRLIREADLLLRVGRPTQDEIKQLKPAAVYLAFTDPFNDISTLKSLNEANISVISMEFIPRTTRAQKMDALSSQANLAGYAAAVLAANHLPRIFPMLMTAAGTLSPARVFVIGAGVAGLQAIATARRLGAVVEAFDTRPTATEEIKSLGARSLRIDLGETGQTENGYARALTEEQMAQQRTAMKRACATADVVITAAQVFGRKAPVIVTRDILDAMKPGSVVVDLAVDNGGNVEGVVPGQIEERGGVKIIGYRSLPGRMAAHATQVYASNLVHFIEEFWDQEPKSLKLDLEDEIIDAALIAHAGEIRHEKLRALK